MITPQRTRTGTLDWARLRAINAPFRALGINERPNTEIIKMMVDMYPDDELVRGWSQQLLEKRTHVLRGGGEQYQEYDQKDMAVFAPQEYAGTTKIGRAYTHSLLPRLPSKLLNTIYKETHMELDLKCAFATMLTQLFRDCNTHVMKLYVQHPEVVYTRLRFNLGMDKMRAKKLINSIICAYPNVAEDPSVGNWAEIGRDETVEAIKFEVGLWAEALRERFPRFYEMVATKCNAEGKNRHIDGTALSYLAADMEHSVMRASLQALFPGDGVLQDVVWKYDGILIPKAALAGKPQEQWVRDLRLHVQEKLMLDVDFHLNNLHENSLGICLGPDERDRENGPDAYGRWKGRFEKTFARVSCPPVFMMFSRGGKTFYDLKKQDFEHVTMEQPKEFMKQWLEDPEKRMYKGREFVPPPLEIEDGYLNLYHGIAAADLPPNEEPVDITLYLNHVDILTGKNPDYTAYMHKLIAQKIQTPGLKWRVMPIIMSTQGVGKDIWYDFLAEVIGIEQCVKGDGVHKFVGNNSHVLEGKLLCCFQEMGYKDTRDHEEALKALITNATIQLEKKYVNSFHVTNVVDFIGFTNNFGAINVSPDDRRYFLVVADSTYAQDKDYILPLLAFFQSDRNKRAVYDYYKSMNLAGFDSSADRPVTEAHQEMVELNVSLLDRFLFKSMPMWRQAWREQDRSGRPGDWDFNMLENETLRIKMSVVLEAWMDFAKEMGIEKADKKNSMIQFLGRQVRELNGRTHKFVTEGHPKLVDKAMGNARQYFFDVVGIDAYLAKIFGQQEAAPETQIPQHDSRYRSEMRERIDTHLANIFGQQEARQQTLHHAPPNSRYRYELREGGAVVFVTDSLEEANKHLGEAYVETRFDEALGEHVQFLVHPFRNQEIPLGREYLGDGGRARLEAKYPFYVRDRTV